MRKFFAFLLILSISAAAKVRTNSDWKVIQSRVGKNTRAEMKSFSPEDFSLALTQTQEGAAYCGVQIARNIDRTLHTQSKIYFRARVIGGGEVSVYLILSIRENGKTKHLWGPKIKVAGSQYKRYLFGIDSDFKQGDQELNFRQFKPSISVIRPVQGKTVKLEVCDFQMDVAENIGAQAGKPDVTVYPPEHPALKPLPDAARIFFHFDNNDFKAFSSRGLTDPVAYKGFREFLISSVKRNAVLADSPEQADAVVYASANPDPAMAKRIVGCVRNGTPLYVAAIVSDPEIRELLPVTVKERKADGFPKRETVRAADAEDPIFRGLSKTTFGVYHDCVLKPNAKARLFYADGNVLIAEGKAGKGTVIFNSLGIGVALIPGKAAFDPLLFRIVSELTGKKIPEKAEPAVRENGWLPGASENNVGRFGFILGDGLLCETINNVLTVSSGTGEYEFRTALSPKLRIPEWNIRFLSGPAAKQKIRWDFRYPQVGEAEMTANVTIPENWKGKKLRFQVENGIDDTAAVWFNGQFLGEVTKDMPNYWKRPHRYEIPEESIRFGKNNTIRVLARNLRELGGFGSCPEITPVHSAAQKWDVYIDRINPLGKGGVVKDSIQKTSWRFDTSPAFPGIRWEFFGPKIHFMLNSVARHAAVFRNGKTEIIDLTKADSIPCGNWDLPALLFFKEEKGSPLLVVFAKKPDSVAVNRLGGVFSGISIERKNGIGMLLPLWLYGRESRNSEKWSRGLPEETMKRIRFWIPKAFAYPVAFKETFRIDEKAKRVMIRSRYSFRDTENDWGIRPEHYAPVSPLAFMMKNMFCGEGVENWKLATSFGWYAAKPGTDTVEWSLPLPEDNLELVPRIAGQEKIHALTNDIFRKGARFIGGGRSVSTSTFAHPFKKDHPGRNISMHMWLHGSSCAVTAFCDLDAESRKILTERLSYRMIFPVEQYAYKSASWREETFSGFRYPIFYGSPHLYPMKFAPGKGSNFIICDNDESIYMISTVSCFLAAQMGQADFIRANEAWFRTFSKLLFLGDDWLTLTSHCGESGLSAAIDMLNCEYPGMLNLARIAETIGDQDLRAQCLYRASRRMVATASRLVFKHYAYETGILPHKPKDVYGVGFSENGFDYRLGEANKHSFSYHLYDMSQGIPPALFPLYRKYAEKDISDFIRDVLVPDLTRGKISAKEHHVILNIASHYPVLSKERKIEELQKCLKNKAMLKWLSRDFRGLELVPNIAMALDQIYGEIRIHDSRDLKIRDFSYDPDSKLLLLSVTAGKKPRLCLQSGLPLADSRFSRSGDGLIELPLVPGKEQDFRIRLK